MIFFCNSFPSNTIVQSGTSFLILTHVHVLDEYIEYATCSCKKTLPWQYMLVPFSKEAWCPYVCTGRLHVHQIQVQVNYGDKYRILMQMPQLILLYSTFIISLLLVGSDKTLLVVSSLMVRLFTVGKIIGATLPRYIRLYILCIILCLVQKGI